MSLRDNGVVVVGAGVAGLSAARHLRAHGIHVTLIEAADHAGGRARTTQLWGAPFDHGAAWLHDAERNPLVHLAGPGAALLPSDDMRHERLTVAGRPATPAEAGDYSAAWDALDDAVAPALSGPDTTLAAAMASLRAHPRFGSWAALLALWEGAIIAAADAEVLGLQDWRRNRLDGTNLMPPEGVGTFVTRLLATEARLGVRATGIRWHGPGITIETGQGTIHAAATIVTVSTGVLAADGIRFDPPLPHDVATAVHALPMGLLSKVVFPGTPGQWGIAPDTVLIDQNARMSFQAWPQHRPHLIGYMGGRLAWDVAPDPAEAAALARDELRRTLGASPPDRPVLTTGWGTDPLTLGAYAYAGPGNADMRGSLGAASLAGRVLFAGEATRTDGLAGTVGGAFLSGLDAASRLLDGPARPSARPP